MQSPTDSQNHSLEPQQTFAPLQSEFIPLSGSHLIEASAGTGKTYNITRIYLRLLLEKGLSVENILVMTFTKAATEEIRGRIDEFLRQAFTHWDQWTQDVSNPLFYELGQKIPADKAKLALKLALLQLDDAAIFTIHGFCKRVLSQHAFASGVSFNAAMETDDQEYYLQTIQDLYRRLAAGEERQQEFALISQFWPSPEAFYQSFIGVCRARQNPKVETLDSKIDDLQRLIDRCLQSLSDNEPLIAEHLIDNKTGKARGERELEFSTLRQVLQLAGEGLKSGVASQEIHDFAIDLEIDFRFCGAGRLPKAKDKQDDKKALQFAFAPLYELKKVIDGFAQAMEKIQAYAYVAQYIDDIRVKVQMLKSDRQVLSFDDLIATLENALLSGSHRQFLLQQLRKQYPAALVDEFQDTDAGQFNILSSLYFNTDSEANSNSNSATNSNPNFEINSYTSGEPQHLEQETALYLIGDPKQAIYGFRGGDIFTYLQAASLVSNRWIMDTNWRSSAAMIHAYNVFFYGNALASQSRDVFGYSIAYQPVNAAPGADNDVLVVNGKDSAAMQGVHFNHSDTDISRGQLGKDFSQKMSTWLSNQISQLLLQGTIVDSIQNESRPVLPSDIAILVRDGGQASYVLAALQENNLDAVYKSERSNLLQHPICNALVDALKTIITPEDERRLYGTLAGPFFGFSPHQLQQLQQDERLWENLVQDLQALHQTWQKRGFMPMAMKLLHDYFPQQYQSELFGSRERMLTNCIHLFEILQGLSQQHRHPLQLISHFDYLCQNPQMVETELRLESDSDLIQVVTQHGSKGLEYPIVFVPFACIHKDPMKAGIRTREVLSAHNEQGDVEIALGANEALAKAMCDEQYAEDTRLLYVALTRAKLQCYLFSADFKDSAKSPLGRALDLVEGNYPDAWQQYATHCQHSVEISVIDADNLEPQVHQVNKPSNALQAAQFRGRIERDWWLTSFSGLTRGHRHYGLSDPDRLDANQMGQDIERITAIVKLPKGAKTGNLLHDILEHLDFSAPDAEWLANRLQNARLADDENVAQGLTDWLLACLTQPFHVADKSVCSLASLTKERALKELEFYFPVSSVKVQAISQYLQRFRGAFGADAAYSAMLPTRGDIQGMMHGFIDLVFEHEGKYYVCDYKSSYLGDHFENYDAKSLQQHMFDNFYDLQALIYSLALHRYLQTRIEDYSFEQHFGGAVYLYLRGMGQAPEEQLFASDNNSYGVYFNPLSEPWLMELDNLIAGQQECIEG
nr:exodeoxyribonuclease V subunit beta [Thalassotalea sp. PS06]